MDASLVKAHVSGCGLEPSGMTMAEFKEQAIEENGLFMLTATTVADDCIEHEEFRYFQQPPHFNILLDCLAPLAMTVRVETGTTRCFAPAPTRWFGLRSQSLRSARRTGT